MYGSAILELEIPLTNRVPTGHILSGLHNVSLNNDGR